MAASDRPDSTPTIVPPPTMTPALACAMDNVIIAASQAQHWLKPGDPPFGEVVDGKWKPTSLKDGIALFDIVKNGSARYDLWVVCVAIEAMRRAAEPEPTETT